ncbi:uncharacterized protein LOC113225531 [Hyposmocoma kahamanoa]|uniref:uncharacterized protein LOC113225531 n=1 Tax=Hyposmocoma kahamanoa TaxID=1477025 RepID=UPI000E6D92B4|nr:uncharacterized protein LOC113225531 [Hyposmocoma kahamanoa]
MKLLYIFFSPVLVLLPVVNWSEGQSYHNMSKFFANMSFGQVHRGGFNISECTEDLMNCWENIVPDNICHQWIIFGTVCDTMREYCLDMGAETYTVRWWHRWFIRENNCLYWWYTYAESRRAAAPPPPPAPAPALARLVRFRGSYNFHFVPEP